MKRAFNFLLAAALGLASVTGIAAGTGEAAAPGAAAGAAVPAPKNPLAQAAVMSGTLGTDAIQASLRPKADPDEGFEGEYRLAGQSGKTLLAGELDGDDDVYMEESVNGKDVSGQWNGKLQGGVFSGTWQSADGLVTKPFRLQIVRAGETPAAADRVQASTVNQHR
jgi:hypothetical protein